MSSVVNESVSLPASGIEGKLLQLPTNEIPSLRKIHPNGSDTENDETIAMGNFTQSYGFVSYATDEWLCVAVF